jgi:hypothetical protein
VARGKDERGEGRGSEGRRKRVEFISTHTQLNTKKDIIIVFLFPLAK